MTGDSFHVPPMEKWSNADTKVQGPSREANERLPTTKMYRNF
jgi:hypothetical protein